MLGTTVPAGSVMMAIVASANRETGGSPRVIGSDWVLARMWITAER